MTDPVITTQLYIFLITFCGCFFSVISGGGAGFITLPLFLLIGLPFPNALAIHKLGTTALGFGSLLRLKNENLIDKKLFWLTGLLPCPFVIIGTFCSEILPTSSLKPVLGVFIILCLYLSFQNRKVQLNFSPKKLSFNSKTTFIILLSTIGFYNGLLSAGSGVFIILLYVWILGYDQIRANALMVTAAAIFWNGTSLLTHLYLGHIIWELAPMAVISSMLGSYIGTSLGIKKGNPFLFKMFIVSALITAALLIL